VHFPSFLLNPFKLTVRTPFRPDEFRSLWSAVPTVSLSQQDPYFVFWKSSIQSIVSQPDYPGIFVNYRILYQTTTTSFHVLSSLSLTIRPLIHYRMSYVLRQNLNQQTDK
jgi:hypothetical protein